MGCVAAVRPSRSPSEGQVVRKGEVVERGGGMGAAIREGHPVSELERLTAAVQALAAEQAVLSGLVHQLAERGAPQRWMRTGAMCKLAGIHRATLYSWCRAGLVGRGQDAIGEVVWDREEVLRAMAAQAKRRRARSGVGAP